MNLFISKIYQIFDKIHIFVIGCKTKIDRSGKYINNQKSKKDKEMKKYKLEQFLQDSQADIGTGLLITRGFGFCFTLKQPHRWGKTKAGFSILPFGGIGGKVEQNELPATSLYREAIEEVGSDVEIVKYGNQTILMDSDSIQKISLVTDLLNEPLPIIIFRIPRAEVGRKLFTNVLIYAGKFTSSEIKSIDDPALFEMNGELLLHLVKKPMSVKEFRQAGGKIISKIELPDNGILKPIGTAIAIARCLKAKVITSQTFE
ncbi:MAG: NUDIX hydrolase [Candidatus Nealsonbacteria bacterium]